MSGEKCDHKMPKGISKNFGERYIPCDDLIVVVQHQDEELWEVVQYFYEFIAMDKQAPWYENMRFKLIAHDGISSIYIAQRFYETHPNIRANLKYISLHRGCGTLDSIKQILKDTHDDYEPLAKKIYKAIKKHFVVIDIRRPANDPLSIRYRWDKPLLKTVTYKKLSTRTRKFLRSDTTRLSPEAIEEIRNAQNNIPNAQRIMCKKHHIGATIYQKIIDNQRPPEPTEEWRRILDFVNVSDRISENNKESL
ncbi:30342_t:CDS:2 [Gigaspora margarita]|uniref:30342_t:CDS:1 n=1 Tax=Gigaspora margarita TaxID=4874 RepID=A0ABN7VF59_GIGMA|nr:30342_t:CDS:2 [Gigaspora margarita]